MDTTSPEHPLSVVYQDESLLVVHKPSGMAVHRGWAPAGPTAIEAARELSGRFVHNVHRLDRATSGLLLMCFEAEVARALQQQWPQIDKRYLALVRGRPKWGSPEGATHVLDYPIPNKADGERVPAISSYRCLAHSGLARCAWVEVRPHTGRLHQVRRHLKHLQHPIVGDVRYGDGRVNRAFRSEVGLHRLGLHAWSLRLRHPVSQAPLRIDLEPSESLAAALGALGLEPLPPDAGPELARQRRPAEAEGEAPPTS